MLTANSKSSELEIYISKLSSALNKLLGGFRQGTTIFCQSQLLYNGAFWAKRQENKSINKIGIMISVIQN